MNREINEKLLTQLHQCTILMHRRGHCDVRERKENLPERGQGRLLVLLLERDGMSHKDIVEALDIRPSSESELVAKLESAGYVTKSVNEEDKRVSNVFLTDKGREIAQQFADSMGERLDGIFAPLDEAERETLSGLLEKLIVSWKEREAQMQTDDRFGAPHGRCGTPHEFHGHDREHCGHGRGHGPEHRGHGRPRMFGFGGRGFGGDFR